MIAILTALILSPRLLKIDLKIHGTDRLAWVSLPAVPSRHPPLVIAFHGHGGNAIHFSNKMHFSNSWPNALIIYPEGLPTKTPVDPQGSKNGWQYPQLGGQDRDIDFVDALLNYAKKTWGTVPSSSYAVGHSNGAGMTYTLWHLRPNEFSGFCMMAGPPFAAFGINSAKPFMIIAGKNDPLVKFNRQIHEANVLMSLDNIEGIKVQDKTGLQKFSSKKGLNVWIDIYDGGHAPPKDAPELVTSFFKQLN